MKQCASTILMIRPVNFRMNEQTAVNNYYQKVLKGLTDQEIQDRAVVEFNGFVIKLRECGIRVIDINDTVEPNTPDSIFPNNWISFHEDGRVGLYPMFAKNRRMERREEILAFLSDQYNFKVDQIVDFTEFEEHSKFLEGTGSIVLDRVNKKAYAAISPRTDLLAFEHFCDEFDYESIAFSSYQTVNNKRELIYHTNVMMCIAEKFAVICLDTLDDGDEKRTVEQSLRNSGLEIIEISAEQTQHFAGNMLYVCSADGSPFTVMSHAAYSCLDASQIGAINKYCPIIYSNLDTIEACGGGSARCMMAEVFLPKSQHDEAP